MWQLYSPTWLEDLVLEFCYNSRHKGGVSVGEKGNRGNQRPTVVVYHILQQKIGLTDRRCSGKREQRSQRPTVVVYHVLQHKNRVNREVL